MSGITFPVADTEPADYLLFERPARELLDRKLVEPGRRRARLEGRLRPLLVCYGQGASCMIGADQNPFVMGLHHAFADHRPFIISPDMIWLLLMQGFASHVNINADELHSKFAGLNSRVNLEIEIEWADHHSASPVFWERKVFPEFISKIVAQVDRKLAGAVDAKFSTTGMTEKTSFAISLMDAVSSQQMYTATISCGIPSITLEGEPADWQLLRKKAEVFAQYDLEWWWHALKPLLDQFCAASSGVADRSFWSDIYQYQTVPYTSTLYIGGWIVQFFPYIISDGHFHRNPWVDRNVDHNECIVQKEITGGNGFIEMGQLPIGLSKADFLLHDPDTHFFKMQLFSGFTGVEQIAQTGAMRPAIGWGVVDTAEAPVEEELRQYWINTLIETNRSKRSLYLPI